MLFKKAFVDDVLAGRKRQTVRLKPPRVKPGRSYAVQTSYYAASLGRIRVTGVRASTLRRLSRAEAARLKPLRLRIETVRSGDTERTFAERMVVPELSLEWFRTLNALEPGEFLRPGRRVKLIEE